MDDNWLVHPDDGSGNATGEPLYSGTLDGAREFVRENGGVIVTLGQSGAIIRRWRAAQAGQ